MRLTAMTSRDSRGDMLTAVGRAGATGRIARGVCIKPCAIRASGRGTDLGQTRSAALAVEQNGIKKKKKKNY